MRYLHQLALLAAFTSPCFASERMTAVYQNLGAGAPALLREVDLEAGGVANGPLVDLGTITPFAIPTVRWVARVETETWVATSDGILRYGGAPLAYIDRALPGTDVQRVFAVPGGAVAQSTATELLELDSGGNVLVQRPYPGFLNDFVWDGGGAIAIALSFFTASRQVVHIHLALAQLFHLSSSRIM